MFKGACRLDDPAHRTIILAANPSVNEIIREIHLRSSA